MRIVLLVCLLSLSSPAPAAEQVDFACAFAPPHRITIGRPGASEKTLLDVEPGFLTVSWSYEDLRDIPLSVWKPPRIAWRVLIQPLIDGKPFGQSSWTRHDLGLPLLENVYRAETAFLRIPAIGGASGALMRVTARNTDNNPHTVAVRCEVQGGWVTHNPAWIESGPNPDVLLAMEHERPIGSYSSPPAPPNTR
jgi:hypothetical protein